MKKLCIFGLILLMAFVLSGCLEHGGSGSHASPPTPIWSMTRFI